MFQALDPEQQRIALSQILRVHFAAPTWWLTLEEVALAWGKSLPQTSRLIRRNRCITRGSRQNNFRVFRQHVALRLLNEARLGSEWPARQEIAKAIEKFAAINDQPAYDPCNNRGGLSALEIEELGGTEVAARKLLAPKIQATTASWRREQHGARSDALLNEFLGQVIEPLVAAVQDLLRARILIKRHGRAPVSLIGNALRAITLP
jgi:hypothetical protein